MGVGAAVGEGVAVGVGATVGVGAAVGDGVAVGVGVARGGLVGVVLGRELGAGVTSSVPTMKVAVRLEVPDDVSIFTEIAWLPLPALLESQGLAFPALSVPAKSSGAEPST